MLLANEDIVRIAQLARIAISKTDRSAVCTQLNAIFSMIQTMQAVNTEGVEPMAHPQDLALHMREDRVSETNQRDLFQAIAPRVEQGLYLVPKVIE